MRNLQMLVPFVQAVKCGSFAAAAAQLDVTPPAISKSIARLERELGVRLFNRTTRHLELTNEGERFYEHVRNLLGALDDAVGALAQSTREPEGVVRVSVTATFGRHCLLPTLPEFIEQFPRVELDLSFDEVPRSFGEQGVDVRIQHVRSRATSQVSRVLCDYPIVLAASPEYLRRKGIPREPAALASHQCIGVRVPYGKSAWRLVCHRGTSARGAGAPEEFLHRPAGPITVATQLDASLIACLAGAGIAPCSVPTILPHLERGELKVLLSEYRVRGAQSRPAQVFIQFPHREHLTAKVRAFVDFVSGKFRDRNYLGMDVARFAA
jgi:LysR family transcriptional activator of dmlA